MSLGDVEIGLRRERLRLWAVEPMFGVVSGAEVTVSFEPPAEATLHVYGREIADGDLMCSLGTRRAVVRMDLALAARIVAEGLARGLTLPRDEARALGEALARQQG